MLLRDWISRALVGDASRAAATSGYFSKAVVQRVQQPLPFRSFRDEHAYRQALADLYAKSDRAWLTPVEIFQPHYADAMARSMLGRHRRLYGASEPLQILEACPH